MTDNATAVVTRVRGDRPAGNAGQPFCLTYRAEPDAPTDAPDFITFLARYLPVKVKGKLTGESKLDILPVRFIGPSRVVAEDRAMAFWHDETSKKQASKERGKTISRKGRK